MSAAKVWALLEADAARWRSQRPLAAVTAARLIDETAGWAAALTRLVVDALAEPHTGEAWRAVARDAFARDDILGAAARDLLAAKARNDAFHDHLAVFAATKGFLALAAYRVANHLRAAGRRADSDIVHHRATIVTGIDLSPGAALGSGLLLDHGTGIVVGETAAIEDDVAIWHGVTLGSTFTETKGSIRHPTIRRGALLCAGATILGAIEIGAGAMVGAGSLVLHDVPPGVTVAGRPARIVSDQVKSSLVSVEG